MEILGVSGSLLRGNQQPKTPKFRNLILPAALFPDTKEEYEANKLSLQKQISVYRAVFNVAKEEGITSAELVTWVESRNGIERIRLKKDLPTGTSSSGTTGSGAGAMYQSAARKKLLAQVQHTYDTADRFGFNAETEGKQVVLLATYRKGSIEVHGATTEGKVFSAACNAYLFTQAANA